VIITKLQVAPVELDVSSQSSCAVRLARHSKNAWTRHVECVESSRVKWNLSLFNTERSVERKGTQVITNLNPVTRGAISAKPWGSTLEPPPHPWSRYW